MSDLIPLPDVQSRIYRIRGQQVMLDVDLADLYGVETRVLNQAVKRNVERFPGDFMFQLSRWEIARISQIVISSGRREGLKFSKRVAVFTEQGVAMLSGVLNSPLSIQVNIAIMRAFVKLRHAVLSSRDLTRRVEKVEGRIDLVETDVRLMLKDIRELKDPPRQPYPKIKGFTKE